MKAFITFTTCTILAGVMQAQMSPLPPSASADSVAIQSIGANAGATHWDSTANLGSFKTSGLTEGTNPLTSIAYNPIGLAFGSSMPALFQSSLNAISTSGGIIRTIFLSESAGWQNSLGYSYSGNFNGPQSYTAFTRMDDTLGSSGNIKFGDHFDVTLPVGTAKNFDFWFQGEDSTYGGDYSLFKPANSSAAVAPGNALWAQQSIAVNTWNAALGSYVDVSTFVVGLEDWRLDRGSDRDYSDAIIAFQFYSLSGTPISQAVPEPATYGYIAAATLLGLIAIRRRSRKS